MGGVGGGLGGRIGGGTRSWNQELACIVHITAYYYCISKAVSSVFVGIASGDKKLSVVPPRVPVARSGGHPTATHRTTPRACANPTGSASIWVRVRWVGVCIRSRAAGLARLRAGAILQVLIRVRARQIIKTRTQGKDETGQGTDRPML